MIFTDDVLEHLAAACEAKADWHTRENEMQLAQRYYKLTAELLHERIRLIEPHQ